MSLNRSAFVIILVATVTLHTQSATASLIITINQEGSDVVATGTGSINLAALTFEESGNQAQGINPGAALIAEGTPPNPNPVDIYRGFTGPTDFGTINAFVSASSGTGDQFSIAGLVGNITVPQGYTSDSPLTATDTYTGQSFSSLGLTPGTYTWTWGTGASADSFTVQIGPAAVVPEPSTAIQAVIGVVTLSAYGWSRHRRVQRQAAA
jgi:hypothetical protein